MKVTIINNSSASITVKGRHTLNIEGQKTNVFNIPDNQQMANTLNRLRREYPALKITVEKEAKAGSAPQKAGNPNEPAGNGGSNSQIPAPEGEKQPNASGNPNEPESADKDSAPAKASSKNKAGK